jgi:hypothetical protein
MSGRLEVDCQGKVMVSNLSKQTYFAPSRNLPRVRCKVLNHQRLSTLRWDNLLTSLRSGSSGSLVSFVQQHPGDGYLEEWHPSFLATKANAEDNPTWNEAMTGPSLKDSNRLVNQSWTRWSRKSAGTSSIGLLIALPYQVCEYTRSKDSRTARCEN